jgi:REP element-mobilizing transposase RayT
LINAEWKNDLYRYITGIVQNKNNKMLAINGMSDHIHLFIGLHPALSVSNLVKDIKLASNDWINTKNLNRARFEWQDGFGAFSYSRSQVHAVCNYIENQQAHHRKKTFRQEYISFLKKFEVPYDERYLFTFFDDLYPVVELTGHKRRSSTPTESPVVTAISLLQILDSYGVDICQK